MYLDVFKYRSSRSSIFILVSILFSLLGPLDEARQVPLGLNVLPDAEVPGALLKKWVNDSFGLELFDGQRGGCHLLALLLNFLLDHCGV